MSYMTTNLVICVFIKDKFWCNVWNKVQRQGEDHAVEYRAKTQVWQWLEHNSKKKLAIQKQRR